MFSNSSESILVKFSEYYAKIHGRIVFPLTIFGILASLVTIVVLHQKAFRTPTNLILQHVAFFDTVVLISYNIYSLYFYILHQPNPFVGQSQFWPWFAIFHSNVGLTAHSIALWLTCLLAIVSIIQLRIIRFHHSIHVFIKIRYTIISKPKQAVVNSNHVIILVSIVAVSVCLLMIPNYLIWSVVCRPAYIYLPHLYTENSTEIVYWVSAATGNRLEKLSFVTLAVCFKILPVFILIVFSLLLILNIHYARQLRKRLHRPYIHVSSSSSTSSSSSKRELRTTRMLVFIALFTALVEFPQGLLFIASGINTDFFFLYSHLGDVWDITSIGSSFITFIMYCLMSQQFRVEICTLILPKCFTQSFHLKKEHTELTSGIGLRRQGRTHTLLTSPKKEMIPQDL